MTEVNRYEERARYVGQLFRDFKVAKVSIEKRIEELNKNKNFDLASLRVDKTKASYEKALVDHVKRKPSQCENIQVQDEALLARTKAMDRWLGNYVTGVKAFAETILQLKKDKAPDRELWRSLKLIHRHAKARKFPEQLRLTHELLFVPTCTFVFEKHKNRKTTYEMTILYNDI